MADFIKTKAEKFSGLEVEYVQGMRPQLSMHSESGGEAKDSFSITDWTSDSIAEYLTDQLAK